MYIFVITILVLLVGALAWAYDYKCRELEDTEGQLTAAELELSVANNIIAGNPELLLKQKLGAAIIAVEPATFTPHAWDHICGTNPAQPCEWCPSKDTAQLELPFNVVDLVPAGTPAYWGD